MIGDPDRTPWHYGDVPITSRVTEWANVRDAIQTAPPHDNALTWYENGERRDSWSYGALVADVARLAVLLASRYGITRGDRVILASSNSPEAFMAHLAIMSIGGIVVPVNNAESPQVFAFIVESVDPKLILFGRDVRLEANRPVMLSTLQVGTRDVDPRNLIALEAPTPDDIAVILFTSGTTSDPKGVCLSHYNILANAEGLRRTHDLKRNRNHLCMLPLFHANAFGFSMIGSIYSRVHVVLCNGFPAQIWDIARVERVNIISAIPQILRVIGGRPMDPQRLPDLRYIVSAAAPLSRDTVEMFRANTGKRIHQGYGLSETTNFAASIPHGIRLDIYDRLMTEWRVPSIGPQLYGNEMAIRRGDGSEAAALEEGEILIAGHNVMQGYWNAPHATQEAFRDNWFNSGDLGFFVEIDGTRYFFVTGRVKEIIIRHGQNISPRLVEDLLIELSAVGEFAVCGFPNDASGEEIGLYLRAAWSDDHSTHIGACLSRCAAKYRPRVVLVGQDPVPATVTGKIKRGVLAQRFEHFRDSHLGDLPLIQSWT